jgi:hypothetical protein
VATGPHVSRRRRPSGYFGGCAETSIAL